MKMDRYYETFYFRRFRFQRIYGSGAMRLYTTRDSWLIFYDWRSIFSTFFFWTGLSDGVLREN